MALQGSGTITMDQIGREFAGPKPYRVQDHYRGGGRVPTTIPGNYVPGNPGNYVPGNPGGCNGTSPWTYWASCPEHSVDCSGSGWSLMSRTFRCPDGTEIPFSSNQSGCDAGGSGSYCDADWSSRGAAPGALYGVDTRSTSYTPPRPPYTNPSNPPYTNPAQPINTGVPSSGTIKLSNFYGARRS